MYMVSLMYYFIIRPLKMSKGGLDQGVQRSGVTEMGIEDIDGRRVDEMMVGEKRGDIRTLGETITANAVNEDHTGMTEDNPIIIGAANC